MASGYDDGYIYVSDSDSDEWGEWERGSRDRPITINPETITRDGNISMPLRSARLLHEIMLRAIDCNKSMRRVWENYDDVTRTSK